MLHGLTRRVWSGTTNTSVVASSPRSSTAFASRSKAIGRVHHSATSAVVRRHERVRARSSAAVSVASPSRAAPVDTATSTVRCGALDRHHGQASCRMALLCHSLSFSSQSMAKKENIDEELFGSDETDPSELDPRGSRQADDRPAASETNTNASASNKKNNSKNDEVDSNAPHTPAEIATEAADEAAAAASTETAAVLAEQRLAAELRVAETQQKIKMEEMKQKELEQRKAIQEAQAEFQLARTKRLQEENEQDRVQAMRAAERRRSLLTNAVAFCLGMLGLLGTAVALRELMERNDLEQERRLLREQFSEGSQRRRMLMALDRQMDFDSELPPPEMWMDRGSLQDRLATLIAAERVPIIFVEGSWGAGKSTMLKKVLNQRRAVLHVDGSVDPPVDGKDVIALFLSRAGYILDTQIPDARSVVVGDGDLDADITMNSMPRQHSATTAAASSGSHSSSTTPSSSSTTTTTFTTTTTKTSASPTATGAVRGGAAAAAAGTAGSRVLETPSSGFLLTSSEKDGLKMFRQQLVQWRKEGLTPRPLIFFDNFHHIDRLLANGDPVAIRFVEWCVETMEANLATLVFAGDSASRMRLEQLSSGFRGRRFVISVPTLSAGEVRRYFATNEACQAQLPNLSAGDIESIVATVGGHVNDIQRILYNCETKQDLPMVLNHMVSETTDNVDATLQHLATRADRSPLLEDKVALYGQYVRTWQTLEMFVYAGRRAAGVDGNVLFPVSPLPTLSRRFLQSTVFADGSDNELDQCLDNNMLICAAEQHNTGSSSGARATDQKDTSNGRAAPSSGVRTDGVAVTRLGGEQQHVLNMSQLADSMDSSPVVTESDTLLMPQTPKMFRAFQSLVGNELARERCRQIYMRYLTCKRELVIRRLKQLADLGDLVTNPAVDRVVKELLDELETINVNMAVSRQYILKNPLRPNGTSSRRTNAAAASNNRANNSNAKPKRRSAMF